MYDLQSKIHQKIIQSIKHLYVHFFICHYLFLKKIIFVFMGSDHSKKESTIQDILLPLKKSGVIDQKLYDLGKIIVKYLQNKQYQQLDEHFKSKQKEYEINQEDISEVCLRLTKKDQIGYQCKTCSNVHATYFCSDCFSLQQHAMHDYHAIENKRIMCECGNDQKLNKQNFCKRHCKVATVLRPEDIALKKEIKFYVQLLLFLKQSSSNSKNIKTHPPSFEYFGQSLFKYLRQVSKRQRNKVIIAQALQEKVDMLINSEVRIKTNGNCLLEDIIFSLHETPSITTILVDLIGHIFWSGTINKQLLRTFYRIIFIGGKNNCISNIYQKLRYDIVVCPINQLEYFKDESNCRFFINRAIETPEILLNQYTTFYQIISKILSFKHSTTIITNIMRETPLTKLFNYHFEQAKYETTINKLTLTAYYLARRIIKAIEDKDLLKIIALNALQAIKKKKEATLDFIFERCFALAIYQYFDFRIPKESEIKTLFPEIKLNPQELLLEFWQAKNIHFDDYLKYVIKNEEESHCPAQTLLATDQLYLKLLLSLITSKDQISSLYHTFISDKILHLKQPFTGIQQIRGMIDNNNILKSKLQQLSIFISTLSGSINSNLSQLIIKGCQSNDEQSINSILNYLALVFEGCNAVEFKTNSERFTNNQAIVTFIKEKIVLEGKKIHFKQQIKNTVTLYPFSEYFPFHLSQVVIERMMTINLEQGKNRTNLYIEEECLRHLLILLYACIQYIQNNPNSESTVQNELKRTLKNILAFSGQKRTKQFISLVHRIHKKMSNTSTVIENFLKRMFQSAEQMEIALQSDNARTNKKKQKLLDLKQKQKNMLQTYQIDEEQRSAECIVCKNSKSGNPFLLANFGYKNIFSKIVCAQTPFLEFSSCGHYIHEQCLQESHKGDFKIWYSCILCKSICNILLPNVTNRQKDVAQGHEEELFQRVLTFLKNLGGIYTFFYQDRKQLVEFNLDNVEGVFPLLFKTLAYQITFYPILNLQYFQRSHLPVTRFLFDLLKFTAQKLRGVTIVKKVNVKGDHFFVSLFNYVSDELSYTLRSQSGQAAQGGDLPTDIIVMIGQILYMLNKRDQKMEITPRATKEYRDKVVQIFLKPPQDLRELQLKSRQCPSCKKDVTNYELCLLCDWSCCAKCHQVKKVHCLLEHQSQSVFLRNANGKCVYVHQELLGQFNSLYVDYLGEEYNTTEKAPPNTYMISKDKWQTVIDDLLNNRLHREVMKFQ